MSVPDDFRQFAERLGIPDGRSLKLEPWQDQALQQLAAGGQPSFSSGRRHGRRRAAAREIAVALVAAAASPGDPPDIAVCCPTVEAATSLFDLVTDELESLGRVLNIDAAPLIGHITTHTPSA